jgi:hypothetical protein
MAAHAVTQGPTALAPQKGRRRPAARTAGPQNANLSLTAHRSPGTSGGRLSRPSSRQAARYPGPAGAGKIWGKGSGKLWYRDGTGTREEEPNMVKTARQLTCGLSRTRQ